MNTKQNPNSSRKSNYESGVALITAMLVTALVTVASVAMLSSQQLDFRRVENILHFDQAYMYALGVEGAAAIYLENDPTPNVDIKDEFDLFELYLGASSGTEIEGGTVSGRISQLSGYFPLNNQYNDTGTPKTAYIVAFGAILDNIKTTSGNPELFPPGFEWVVADWIDKDENVSSQGGAEDLDYSNRNYRTANQTMESLSELRLLDLSKEGFEALNGVTIDPLTGEKQLGDPWVNVVPYVPPDGAAININIVDAVVLESVLQSVFPADYTTIVSDIIREQENTNAKDEPIGIAGVSSGNNNMIEIIERDLDNTPLNDNNNELNRFRNTANLLQKIKFDVKTEYFEVVSVAQIGNTVVELKTLMYRDQNRVTIIRRGIGVY